MKNGHPFSGIYATDWLFHSFIKGIKKKLIEILQVLYQCQNIVSKLRSKITNIKKM